MDSDRILPGEQTGFPSIQAGEKLNGTILPGSINRRDRAD